MSELLHSLQVPLTGPLSAVEWARGTEVSVPQAIAAFGNGDIPLSDGATETIVNAVRMHAAFTNSPASSRLPISYQAVPMRLRTAIGHFLGKVQRRRSAVWARFPRWPLDLSADYVADLVTKEQPMFAGVRTPVLLSHDIDTPEGLRNLVPRFLPLEEAVGARSSNYVVPCAWPIDYDLLDETARRGHEIGIHGYDHSNKTPYAPPAQMRSRLEAARPLIERYGILGYRAPSLVRTPELMDQLQRLYGYDSSIPTSGGLFPVPNNGCASARPFRLGTLIEIPLSLPRDGSLRFLGHTATDIPEIWKACAIQVSASGGIVSLLTHCEDRFSGEPAMLEAYRRFLAFVAEDDRFEFSTPAAILNRMAVCDSVGRELT